MKSVHLCHASPVNRDKSEMSGDESAKREKLEVHSHCGNKMYSTYLGLTSFLVKISKILMLDFVEGGCEVAKGERS